MERRDYAYPFRIDGAAHQAAVAPYAPHVAQMIRQVLLTSPGERANLPEFGCGLRQLLFAPISEALTATAQLVVKQALDRWLAAHIKLGKVEVLASDTEDDRITISITYELIETRENQQLTVQVR